MATGASHGENSTLDGDSFSLGGITDAIGGTGCGSCSRELILMVMVASNGGNGSDIGHLTGGGGGGNETLTNLFYWHFIS